MDSLHQTVFVYPLTPIGGRSSDVFPPVRRQAGRNGRADEAGRPEPARSASKCSLTVRDRVLVKPTVTERFRHRLFRSGC